MSDALYECCYAFVNPMRGKFSDVRKNKKSNKLEFTALPRDEPEPAFYHNSSLLSVSPPTPLIATTALSGISEGGRKGETVIAPPPPSPERGRENAAVCHNRGGGGRGN